MGEMNATGPSALSELMERFPILQLLLDREARALSGGERQILALARCLAGRPSLVLLDEPSDGVQPSIVDDIAVQLQALMSPWNLTILLVEQDLKLVAALAKRVFVMQKGRITAELESTALSDRALISERMGL
jgi:ABC-type branched-subunit amino acid transport system ATPase component